MAQVYEGLTYGSGDIVLGINPVDPTPDTLVRILTATYDAMQRWEIPTQNSALGQSPTRWKRHGEVRPSVCSSRASRATKRPTRASAST
jgi:ethanolamine ammonia-lyase large subunit